MSAEDLHSDGEPVRELEPVWITLKDGCRLAARVWLPESAENKPVPAILEYLPYRFRDGTRERDAKNHPYFAAHGYACVRVDIRGTGDSEGLMHDEYLKQEQDDALEILEWLAEQPWCTGDVGMIGISWGGFNGLQVAARQPEQLKAVITICSTDDRYADDVHYMGGCLLAENFSWAATMLAFNSRPPDPAVSGAGWQDKWLHRLEEQGFWLEPWLEHQTRDPYWKHGSICEDFSAVTCPVFAVGGWADAYTNAIPRLLENLSGPRLGLIGPWGHLYPNFGVPGPAIGFLQEALRFWDRWLKGKETGIMDEPQLRAWLQESVPPQTVYGERPGRWVGEPSWPSPHVRLVEHRLAPHVILPAGAAGEAGKQPLSIRSPAAAGVDAGKWFPYGWMPDLPGDQRATDGGSLTFDTEPLEQPLELLGAPVAELELTSDQPVAQIAVRLVDVAPDGTATRLSYGLLNLTHRDSHEHPEPLEPGTRYRVRVQLNDLGQQVPVGHRLRLAVSTNYWPLVWPAPVPVTLTLHPEKSVLSLPVREPRPEDSDVEVAMPAVSGQPLDVQELAPPTYSRTVHRDLETGETAVEVLADDGCELIEEIGLESCRYNLERYTVRTDAESAPQAEADWVFSYRRGDWNARTAVRARMTSSAEEFHIYAELDAFADGDRLFSKTWKKSIPRQLV